MKLAFHVAIFDHANPGPNRDYWVLRHSALPGKSCDSAYYKTISQVVPKMASAQDVGGATTVTPNWICFFRLFEAGPDKQGRSGHFIAVCGFANREQAKSADLSGVCLHPVFEDMATAYQRGDGDSPYLAKLLFELDCPLISTSPPRSVPASASDATRDFMGSQALQEAFASLSQLPMEADWAVDYQRVNGATKASLRYSSQETAKTIQAVGSPCISNPPDETSPSSLPSELDSRQAWKWPAKSKILAAVVLAILILFLIFQGNGPQPKKIEVPAGITLSTKALAAASLLIGIGIGWLARTWRLTEGRLRKIVTSVFAVVSAAGVFLLGFWFGKMRQPEPPKNEQEYPRKPTQRSDPAQNRGRTTEEGKGGAR